MSPSSGLQPLRAAAPCGRAQRLIQRSPAARLGLEVALDRRQGRRAGRRALRSCLVPGGAARRAEARSCRAHYDRRWCSAPATAVPLCPRRWRPARVQQRDQWLCAWPLQQTALCYRAPCSDRLGTPGWRCKHAMTSRSRPARNRALAALSCWVCSPLVALAARSKLRANRPARRPPPPAAMRAGGRRAWPRALPASKDAG